MPKSLLTKIWRLCSPFSIYSMMSIILIVGGIVVMMSMALLPKVFPFGLQFPHLLGWMTFFCSVFLQTPPSLLLWVFLGEGYDTLMGFPSGLTSVTLLIVALTGEKIRVYPAVYTVFMDWIIFSSLWIVLQMILGAILFSGNLALGHFMDILKQSATTLALYPILTSSTLWFLKKRFVSRHT